MVIWDSIDQELVLLKIVKENIIDKDLPIYDWISKYVDELYETTKT